MRTIPRIALAAASLALLALPLHAQSFSIGLRGVSTLPIGDSADPQASSSGQIVAGASSGFGYGLDVGLALRPARDLRRVRSREVRMRDADLYE